ncbi:MAG: winged helix DNA-binding domain-containing protein [Bacteroidota bacterium]
MEWSAEQVAYARFRASHLVELRPEGAEEAVAENLLGMQSQIFTAASLALAMRLESGSHAALAAKFSERRTLIKTWGQRNTVHLYASHTLPLFANAFHSGHSWSKKQFLKSGGSREGYEDLIRRTGAFLRAEGCCTREAIADFATGIAPHFPAVGNWGGILVELGRRGQLCLGGYDQAAGRQLIYSPYHWWPEGYPEPMVPPGAADQNPELMRRYFQAYGPATLADFAHWRGVARQVAQTWREQIADQLITVPLAGLPLYAVKSGFSPVDPAIERSDLPSTLLYRFDPLVLAHKEKGWLVREKDYKKVWRIAAHVEGVVLKQGRIVGVWKFQRKARRLVFVVYHFRSRERLGKRILARKLDRIAAHLGYAQWEWKEAVY